MSSRQFPFPEQSLDHPVPKYLDHAVSKYLDHPVPKYLDHAVSKYLDHPVPKYLDHAVPKYWRGGGGGLLNQILTRILWDINILTLLRERNNGKIMLSIFSWPYDWDFINSFKNVKEKLEGPAKFCFFKTTCFLADHCDFSFIFLNMFPWQFTVVYFALESVNMNVKLLNIFPCQLTMMFFKFTNMSPLQFTLIMFVCVRTLILFTYFLGSSQWFVCIVLKHISLAVHYDLSFKFLNIFPWQFTMMMFVWKSLIGL